MSMTSVHACDLSQPGFGAHPENGIVLVAAMSGPIGLDRWNLIQSETGRLVNHDTMGDTPHAIPPLHAIDIAGVVRELHRSALARCAVLQLRFGPQRVRRKNIR